jgi:hypothetical protein
MIVLKNFTKKKKKNGEQTGKTHTHTHTHKHTKNLSRTLQGKENKNK